MYIYKINGSYCIKKTGKVKGKTKIDIGWRKIIMDNNKFIKNHNMKNIWKLGLWLSAIVLWSCSDISWEQEVVRDNISKSLELSVNIQDAKEMWFDTKKCSTVLKWDDGYFRTIKADYDKNDNLTISSNFYMLYWSEGSEAYLKKNERGTPVTIDPMQLKYVDKDVKSIKDGKLDWIKRNDWKFTDITPYNHRFDDKFYNEALTALLRIDYSSGRCDNEWQVIEDMEDSNIRQTIISRIENTNES